MTKIAKRVLFVVLFGIITSAGLMGIELLDVLHLADGTTVTGVIMEQEPGKAVTIETQDKQLLKYGEKDIERIEKGIASIERDALIQNRDIVYLKDGVVFTGIIVGQVPGESIRLELEDGILLDFQLREIVKIRKEQVATGIVKRASLTPKKNEKEKIEINIQLMQNRLEQARSRAEEKEEGSEEKENIEEEVNRLKEELDQLEQSKEELALEAAEEDEQIAQLRQEFGDIQQQLLQRSDEIAEMIEACNSPELKQRMRSKHGEIQSKVVELIQRAEVIGLLEQPDPRIEEIEAEERKMKLLAIAGNRLWNKPQYRDEFEELSAALTEEQRQEVYREVRSLDVLGSTLRNLVPFVAWGSWKQQDYLGASIAMASTVGGLVTFLVGTEAADNDFGIALTTTGYIGAGVMAAGYIFSLIEPFLFVARNNIKLREALDLALLSADSADYSPTRSEPSWPVELQPPVQDVQLTLVRFQY